MCGQTQWAGIYLVCDAETCQWHGNRRWMQVRYLASPESGLCPAQAVEVMKFKFDRHERTKQQLPLLLRT